MAVMFLDEDKVVSELKHLMALAAQLRGELFEHCFQIQRDVNSVDFLQISFLVGHLRSVEHRIELLKQAMRELPIAAGASNAA